MKKILGLVLVIGLAAVLLGGCNSLRIGGNVLAVRGDGNVIEHSTSVNIDGGVSLQVTGFSLVNPVQTPQLVIDETLGNDIVITADENILEHIDVRITGSTVRIESSGNTRLTPTQLTIETGLQVTNLRLSGAWRAYVTCTRVEDFTANFSGSTRGDFTLGEVNRLDLSGSGSARFTVYATANDARVNISGSGRATLTGAAETVDLRISGSGRVEAFDFLTQTARVNISGSGRVDIAVEEELDARVSGSGRVTYDGNPRISQSVSGSGRVNQR